MRSLIILMILALNSSIAFCSEDIVNVPVYSNSTMYYGTEMKVEFKFGEVKNTPICGYDEDSISIKQSEAIEKSLSYAKNIFDSEKQWNVQEVSLKFLKLDSMHCVYVIQLQPGNEMQSLPIGLLMDGTIKAPVPLSSKSVSKP